MSAKEYTNFVNVVAAHVASYAPFADTCLENIRPSLIWTAKHLEVNSPPECEQLLKGCYGAAVEAVSLVSFGLIRPAVLSLRSHYELSLQYLFYKDHPIEWRNVRAFRTHPNLPGVNKKYMKDNYSKFEDRYKKLSTVKTSTNEDCYGVLSGIAHGTAINSVSSATKPEELIESKETVSQTVSVFLDIGEDLSDIHVACFEGNWQSLPEATRKSLEARFAGNKPRVELDF